MVQAQWGWRSAGIRDGRWTGRTWARGLLAVAVASKVGSSMVWHMACTYSSPMGSTSISAPQWSRWKSAWSSSCTVKRKSRNSSGPPMSSWMFLQMVATVVVSKSSRRCMRLL